MGNVDVFTQLDEPAATLLDAQPYALSSTEQREFEPIVYQECYRMAVAAVLDEWKTGTNEKDLPYQ